MCKKKVVVLLSLIFLIPYSFVPGKAETASINNPDDSCEKVLKVYEDALVYFKNNRGEQKAKKTFLGTAFYNDYNINLWDARRIELTEVVELGCNQVEYIYMESELLVDGQNAYRDIVLKFEACLPEDYFKLDDSDKNTISKSHYIDQRDKDAFLFYDWPEFEITLSNVSNVYVVKLKIYSKKFD